MPLIYLVVGHFTPTDDDPDLEVQGKLDDTVKIRFYSTLKAAEEGLLWYQDGRIFEFSIDVL